MSEFWNNFYKLPLDKIPWQKTQADWFKELVDSKKVTGKIALDIGCGTGMKSVYLALNDFDKVIGIDISPKAIHYAKQNAIQNNVSSKIEFITSDILKYKKNDKFDFILDWALVHCLDNIAAKRYAEIVTKITKKDGLFLVRSFSNKDSSKEFFIEKLNDINEKVYFYSENDLLHLFSNFTLVNKNFSKPRTKQNDYFFTELLLKRN